MSPSKAERLAKLIVKGRQAKGLSQRAAAEQAGIDFSYLSRLERGQRSNPTPDVLRNLARVLELDLEEVYALTVYADKEKLPGLRRYFRTKHGLNDAAIDELEATFESVKAKQKRRGRDG